MYIFQSWHFFFQPRMIISFQPKMINQRWNHKKIKKNNKKVWKVKKNIFINYLLKRKKVKNNCKKSGRNYFEKMIFAFKK